MKSTATSGTTGIVGTAKAVETAETSFDFVRKGLRFHFPLEKVREAMMSDDALLINALKGACEKAAYRNAGEKNALPDEGLVDFDLFVTTVKGFAFRGEEKPNKDDKREAEKFLLLVKEKTAKPEQVRAYFASKGFPIADTDPDTLATACMRIRIADEETAKAKRDAEMAAILKG